ncbi:toxin-antitoxin system YwqK family antitoxin [Flagellimonas sp. 2504JD4-2]
MKQVIFLVTALFSVCMYAQKAEPTLEKVGEMVKATYFHENGEIAQTGHYLEGKLHGQWFMYNQEGRKIASGKYVNGVKSGKWFFWEGEQLKEVDYADNRIVNVKQWSQSEIASTNR